MVARALRFALLCAALAACVLGVRASVRVEALEARIVNLELRRGLYEQWMREHQSEVMRSIECRHGVLPRKKCPTSGVPAPQKELRPAL